MARKGKKGLLFVVSGPSGSGKTTLCREMLKIFPDLYFSVSYTTRPKRPGDEGGRDYHFISPEEFQDMIDRGDFAEWAEIYGHRYGTSMRVLEEMMENGRDVILDIDGQGARQLREKGLKASFIFILPPSLQDLKRRLLHRRTENAGALRERLEKARVEMAEAQWYDYILVNDELKRARRQLESIFVAEHCRRARMLEEFQGIFQSPAGEGEREA